MEFQHQGKPYGSVIFSNGTPLKGANRPELKRVYFDGMI
jgi:hypothetical protein